MADIQKELNQIKNAVYGREVRGSIHDGIDKINKETEVATGKADAAHDVMESIINDGFDNAALEAEFEQKLDDKISNLQPEWTQFKENTETQLAETKKQSINQFEINTSNLGMGKKKKQPVFSIISDDFREEDFSKLLPLITEKNVRVGLGIITNLINTNNYGTWDNLKTMYDTGLVEVLSHSDKHNNSTQMSVEELNLDVKTSLKKLREKGYDPKGFVYPQNAQNESTANVVTRYFPYSFAKSGFNGQARNYPKMNNYAIARCALGSYFDSSEAGFSNTNTLEYYKEKVDEAIANNNWLVFVLHTWHSDMTESQWQYLKEIIDYIRSKGYDIDFPSDGFKKYGNIMQTSYYTETNIDANGKLESKYIHYIVDEVAIDINKKINQLNNQKVYVNTISNTKAASEGWPEGRAGIATTYRLSSVYNFNYQEYLVASNGNLYRRKTNSSHEWTAFQKVGGNGGGAWERVDAIGVPIEITSTDPSNPTSIPLTEDYSNHIYAVDFLIGHNDGRNSQFVQFQGFTGSSAGSLMIGARHSGIYTVNKVKGSTPDSIGFYDVGGIEATVPVYVSKVYVVRRV